MSVTLTFISRFWIHIFFSCMHFSGNNFSSKSCFLSWLNNNINEKWDDETNDEGVFMLKFSVSWNDKRDNFIPWRKMCSLDSVIFSEVMVNDDSPSSTVYNRGRTSFFRYYLLNGYLHDWWTSINDSQCVSFNSRVGRRRCRWWRWGVLEMSEKQE